MNTIIVSSSLDLDQARHLVAPYPGQNCLKRLTADDISKQRGKGGPVFGKVKSGPP